MKRFICGMLTGTMLAGTIALAASYTAEPASFKVMVNGKEFTSAPAMVINGSTYLPLRAMGDALGVPVNWNEELHRAEVGITSDINVSEVSNYVIGEVWNKGFWFLRNYVDGSYVNYEDTYIEYFADSADEKFSIDKIVNHILDTKATMDMYNNKLKSNEKWDKLYEEYLRLYKLVQDNAYTKDNFKTIYFCKVRDEFIESVK